MRADRGGARRNGRGVEAGNIDRLRGGFARRELLAHALGPRAGKIGLGGHTGDRFEHGWKWKRSCRPPAQVIEVEATQPVRSVGTHGRPRLLAA